MRVLLCVLILGLVGCVGSVEDRAAYGKSETVRRSLDEAEVVSVLEGLPHQMFEGEVLVKEVKRVDVRELGSYSFYTPKVEVERRVARRLKGLLVSRRSYSGVDLNPYCGGFHPDYAVVWESGGKEYGALICFGCGQVQFVGAGVDHRYSISQDVEDELQGLLKRYDLKRPKRGL